METTMTEWITTVLVEKYGIDANAIEVSTLYDHLDLDSLALIEIIAKLEKQFNLKIPNGCIHSKMTIEESVNRALECVA